MQPYFGIHTHTMFSNIRLLDCINRPKDVIDKAIELGLNGVAITDHECLSAHMTANKYAAQLQKSNPDFKVALGNEIYLVDERTPGQKYFHFILIAKNAQGHRALRELSSTAWKNSFSDRGIERVPTTKAELTEIVRKYPNSLIATSACMGGELSTNAYLYSETMRVKDMNNAKVYYNNICNFISFAGDLFGDDFYIECAPSTANDQLITNRQLAAIAKNQGIKMVVGTDAHYLTKKDRLVHKAYLNSKDGDREIDSFYEYTYMMDYDEVHQLLSTGLPNATEILENTARIYDKIEYYSLERKQIIPKVEVQDYPKVSAWEWDMYPTIRELLVSDDPQERYWANECINKLVSMNLDGNNEYCQRLEIEADIIKHIGGQLEDCLFAYFNTFKHYIDLFWECGSIVGPGRGSATGFLSNYLLGITQLDPIRWKINYWRFLNKERVELPDIDIDLAPSKRPAIFEAIRKERGELGLVQVAAFGTEGTKSAILTACRGYRSDDYPEGIDVDDAQYMASLVPQERGFLWSIKEVVFGDADKGREPVTMFINEVNKYPGLLDIIISIEGLVNKRSTHASGVILYGDDPYDTASFMKTPGGDIITCFDLHEAEAAGDTKYDFLVTEISDKIIKCFELLKTDNLVENVSLRELYNKYLHPEHIDTNNPVVWEHLAAGDVLDVFQFNTGVGLEIAKKLRPQTPLEMTAANAMMRLMSEKGKESQQDRYYRIQHSGIEVFSQEMNNHGVPKNVQDILHKHCDQYYGCCPIQEQMMEILMDAANFTLGEANAARKVVAKKLMAKIPDLKAQVYEKVNSPAIADYLWELAVAPQLGYAFSYNHSLPYSFVGIQSIILASQFPAIYWNTACLIVNSGATDEEAGSRTDFGKIAKAIGDITSAGITVKLVDINKSKYTFSPNAEENIIYFGLKGILNVGEDVIADTIAKRPYSSPKDYYQRVKPKKSAMISLIKGGAFDAMMDRKMCMAWFIWETCDKKSNLTLQNMAALLKYQLLPETEVEAKRVYEFNRYLKVVCKSTADKYKLDERAINFLIELGYEDLISSDYLGVKAWDKVYQKYMDIFRDYISANKTTLLQKMNDIIFAEDWQKYATGNYSSWEMEVLCFYYHEHELAHVNNLKYGYVDFFKLPTEPDVEYSWTKDGKTFNRYKLSMICGTCIAKNKTKGIVTLLTPSGVVDVKFRKEYFSMFDKQISERQTDGTKRIIEKSWFGRGSMIAVQGMRSGDNFISKKYANSLNEHQLYKILSIDRNGNIALQQERYAGGTLEDEN